MSHDSIPLLCVVFVAPLNTPGILFESPSIPNLGTRIRPQPNQDAPLRKYIVEEVLIPLPPHVLEGGHMISEVFLVVRETEPLNIVPTIATQIRVPPKPAS